jgi:tyrosine-protein phosphatase YwqE
VGFTELHFHLLPGIDDGPPTVDESVALAAAAVAALAIAVVPHARRFAESRPAALLASGLERPAHALAA